MSEQQQESLYLQKLRTIQDEMECRMVELYTAAQTELEKQVAEPPRRNLFYVCLNKSDDERTYVMKCFMKDGIHAELHIQVRHLYNDDVEKTPCVKVRIPDRKK